jgi:uncharacterized protein YacL
MNSTLILLIIITIQVTYLVFKTSYKGTYSSRTGALFLDTSVLMDGRIVTAAQTGFLPSKIVVPRSVINELQLLADQADPEKRSRARRGLDAVHELQDMPYLSVTTYDDGNVGGGGVDERLIDLAKTHSGSICTIDFNLNKAATAMGIRILNINELAGGIRMAFLPGETISMTLTQKGQSNSQAVGYLADGTMVVVDKAASKLNQTVEVEFIRSLQTAAGRMMFAKLSKSDEQPTKTEQPVKNLSSQTRQAGRKRVSSTTSEPVAQQNENSAQNKRQNNRRSSRRKSGEDSLLELVDQQ